MKFKTLGAMSVAIGSLLSSASAHASLIGASLGGSLSGGKAAFVTKQFSPTTVTVGAGPEFEGTLTDVFSQTYDFTVDVTQSNIDVFIGGPADENVYASDAAHLNLSGFLPSVTGIKLTKYDCTNNFSCDKSYTGISSYGLVGSTFTINFKALLSGQKYTFAVQQVATGTPEPATWAMMVIGIGAVGSVMRHRRRTIALG